MAGWGGGREGIYVYVWLIHIVVQHKQTNKLHGRAESSDLALGGHESAFSLIGGFLTKTNFPSTNNCLLDTEASYTKVFLMMKITLHDLTPKGRKIQDKVKSH